MSDSSYQPGRRDDDDPGDERAWDEYDWERFLQQQDQKTEKYMELLEKYLDHPDRDALISKEMGWHHLLDENGKDWSEDLDALFSREMAQWASDQPASPESSSEEASSPDFAENLEQHPLYVLAHTLSADRGAAFSRPRGKRCPASSSRASDLQHGAGLREARRRARR